MDPLYFLIEGILKAGNLIKARFRSHSNETPVSVNSANSTNIIKNIESEGDINIFIITVSEGENKRSETAIDDIIERAGNVVDNHKGSIIFDDDVYAYLKAPQFTENQVTILKRAKKVGWNDEKILALRFAFKVMNLEDAKQCKDALRTFNSMLKSRRSLLLKRMYNFARSGLLDEFMLKSIFSSAEYDDDAMNKKLDYFPEAIFVNVNLDVYSLESDLVRRAHEMVRMVRIYARGKSNIAAIKNCLDVYKTKYLEMSSTVYIKTNEETYEIGCTPGYTVTLQLFQINEDLERIIAHRERAKKRDETIK